MQLETQQLGFDILLSGADQQNTAREREKRFGHLPGTMEEALSYFRNLIDLHHAAMLAADDERVEALRNEADDLAQKLNNFEPGILADEDAPGCVLERLTAAQKGAVPLWGQSGSFEIGHAGMRVGIEMDGIFGIGAFGCSWLGFSAHAVEWERPFLSETGYRSFLGVGGPLMPGYTPDKFVSEIIAAHILKDLKGKLVAIKAECRHD